MCWFDLKPRVQILLSSHTPRLNQHSSNWSNHKSSDIRIQIWREDKSAKLMVPLWGEIGRAWSDGSHKAWSQSLMSHFCYLGTSSAVGQSKWNQIIVRIYHILIRWPENNIFCQHSSHCNINVDMRSCEWAWQFCHALDCDLTKDYPPIYDYLTHAMQCNGRNANQPCVWQCIVMCALCV